MFASDHTTPSDQRPAPRREAPPRIALRPVQPPLPPNAGPDGLSANAADAPSPLASTRSPVDSRAPARLQTLPSWLLSQASAVAARLVDDALSADGLRRQDYRVLVAVDEAGAASQADLGRSVWLDRSDLHGVVTELESRGLIAREGDPADRRRKVVTLTALGETTLSALNARIDQAQDLLLADLSAADRQTLVRLLGELVSDRTRGGSEPVDDGQTS